MAGCGRAMVAVGSQLGSQLGYPAITEPQFLQTSEDNALTGGERRRPGTFRRADVQALGAVSQGVEEACARTR